VIYAVPSGFELTTSEPDQIALASTSGAEAIHLLIDTSQEDTTHVLTRISVGGEAGLILRDGPTADGVGYSEVIIVGHNGMQFEISCVAYAGYVASTLQQGCSSFVQSIRFRA
jgi:hypothetical protein